MYVIHLIVYYSTVSDVPRNLTVSDQTNVGASLVGKEAQSECWTAVCVEYM